MTTERNPHAWTLADMRAPWNGVRVMSTFACGGGSTMGYKRAGCEVIAANDIDPEMARHYQRNHHPRHYFLAPIKELLTRELPAELFNLDILDGSPPCSTFSMAGNREKDWGKEKKFREGQATQVLSDLFFEWIALVDRLKPKVAIAENVKGMLVGNAKGYTRQVVRELERIGYRVQLFLVNAADCGVPQRRERVFFVCSRSDLALAPLAFKPQVKWVSVGEATSDLQVLSESEELAARATGVDEKHWARVQPGQSYKVSTGKSLFMHCRLHSGEPSPTLTATCGHLITHWSVMRKLTLREFVRINSFPDDYQFESKRIGTYMIGMSVPPKMTEQLARAVCAQWLGVDYGATD
jgi:DNA (cytosine-5)-methyltransferase 1